MKKLQHYLDYAKDKYPQQIWVFRYQNYNSLILAFLEDKLDEIGDYSNTGLGIHSFTPEGHMGFTSTNILEEKEIKEAIDSAYESSHISKEEGFEPVKNIKYFKPTKDRTIYPETKDKFSIDQLKDKLAKLNKEILNLETPAKGELSTVSRLIHRKRYRRILRSDGTDINYAFPEYLLLITLNLAINNTKQTHYIIRSKKSLESIDLKSIKEEAKQMISVLSQLSKAPKIKPGRYKILMDGKLGGTFVHEAFGHTAESDAIKVISPLSKDGKFLEGKKVAPKYVNILEKQERFSRSFNPYSSYGIKRKDTYIVKNGKLHDFMSDLGYSEDKEPRGFSRAESFQDIPIPRMSTTILEVESPQNFEFPFNPLIDPIEDIYQHLLDKNIIDKKETYIYLVGNMGGTVDQNQGTFQLAPNFMYKLSNGKATLLKRCSFSGKTLSVLSSIVKASNQKSRDTGMCGKLGQSVPDVGKAPSLTLIDKNKEITLS